MDVVKDDKAFFFIHWKEICFFALATNRHVADISNIFPINVPKSADISDCVGPYPVIPRLAACSQYDLQINSYDFLTVVNKKKNKAVCQASWNQIPFDVKEMSTVKKSNISWKHFEP